MNGQLRKIRSYLALIRVQSVSLMCAFVFLPIFFSTDNGTYALFQTLPIFFLLIGEIVLNDYCDIEKDKVNKPHRPLASGAISPKTGFVTIIVFLLLSLIAGGWAYFSNVPRLILFITVCLTLSVYNIPKPFFTLLKTLITAATTALCLAFAFSYSGFTLQSILFILAAFFYILGRENLMDIRDIPGDRSYGYNTLAIIWGRENALKLAFTSFAVSVVFIVLIGITGTLNLFKVVCLIAIIILIAFLSTRFLNAKNSKEQNRIIVYLWGPIILMLLILFG